VAALVMFASWPFAPARAERPELQASASPTPDAAEAARTVHEGGGYPDDLTVRANPRSPPVPLFGGGSGEDGDDNGQGKDGQGKDGQEDGASAGDDASGDDEEAGGEPSEETQAPQGFTLPGAGAGAWLLSQVFLVGAVAAVLVTLIWLLARWLDSRSGQRTSEAEKRAGRSAERTVRGARAPSEPPPAPTAEPDTLAARGDLEAAIVALLHRALSHAGWRPEGRGRSRTAREVLRSLARTDPRREPLRRIVAEVEAVRFGGAQATEDRYQSLLQLLRAMPSSNAAPESTPRGAR
jgi:hypothetical protein